MADTERYTTEMAYEDGYDQGHADAHADGATEDRVFRERARAEAAERKLAAVEALASEWVGTKGGNLASKVALAHEARHMACLCGAQIGDSIDRHWHTINSAVDAAGRALRDALGTK